MQKRFAYNLDRYLVTAAEEAVLREKGEALSLIDYIARRRENCAIRPCFALAEYVQGIEIPEDVFDHPMIRELENWAVDLGAWGNGTSSSDGNTQALF